VRSYLDIVGSLPVPISLSYQYNFGSLLAVVISIQSLVGVMLAIHYSGSISLAFDVVIYILRSNYDLVLYR